MTAVRGIEESVTLTPKMRSVLNAMALERQEFAKRLKQLREYRGWTQEKAAEEIGMSWRAYVRLEGGELKGGARVYPQPRGKTIDDIVRAFGVDREYLMGAAPTDEGTIRPDGLGKAVQANGRAIRALQDQLDEGDERLLAMGRYVSAQLGLVIAHLGIDTDSLPDAPAEFVAGIDDLEPGAADDGKRVKSVRPRKKS